MGNQYCDTQNDQKACDICQHEQFSRAPRLKGARARTVKTNPINRKELRAP